MANSTFVVEVLTDLIAFCANNDLNVSANALKAARRKVSLELYADAALMDLPLIVECRPWSDPGPT